MDSKSLLRFDILNTDNGFAEWNNSYLTVIDSVEKINAEFSLPLKNRTVLLIVCIKGTLELGYDMTSVKLSIKTPMAIRSETGATLDNGASSGASDTQIQSVG